MADAETARISPEVIGLHKIRCVDSNVKGQMLPKGAFKAGGWQTSSCYSPGMGQTETIAVICLASFTTGPLMRRGENTRVSRCCQQQQLKQQSCSGVTEKL